MVIFGIFISGYVRVLFAGSGPLSFFATVDVVAM